MASETGIVNVGLARAQIRARLTALDTDTSAEARAARDVYDDMRDALQRQYMWSFTKKRAALAQVLTTPAFGFDYGYAMPSDFLRVISVHPSDANNSICRYKVETLSVSSTDTLVLLANANTLYLRYAAKIESAALMDPMFRNVLSWQLGEHFSLSIRESTSQADYCHKRMRLSLSEARAANSIEDWPDEFPDGSWASERGVEGNPSWAGTDSW